MQIICMDGQCLKNYLYTEDQSKFHESFIKNYDKNNDKGHILEVDLEYPKKLFNLHSDSPFLTKRKKIRKCNKLDGTIENREN